MLYLEYILLIVGLIISTMIHYWIIISKQGFKSETPEGFLRHPNLYIITNIVFFVLILIFVEIPWYIIVILYFLSVFIGGALAGMKYKEIVKEIQEEEDKIE